MQDIPPYPNADQVQDFIESEADPVVRSLMRLVYGEFLLKNRAGERPDGACDLMYCFTALQSAFHHKEALENALKGNFGDWQHIDLLPADIDEIPAESAQREAV